MFLPLSSLTNLLVLFYSLPLTSDEQQQHQELDDILSDMLSNVRDIPDIGRTINRSNSYYTAAPPRSHSRSSLPAQNFNQNHHHHHQSSSTHAYEDLGGYNTNTIKRSPSYNTNSSVANSDNQSVISKTSSISSSSHHHHLNHRPHTYVTGEQHYDTASTTTTLTPPPSEYGGRETPLLGSNLLYSQTTTQTANNPPRPPTRQHPPHLYISDLDDDHYSRGGGGGLRHQQQQQQQRSSTISTTTTNSNTMDLQQRYRRELSPGQESSSQSVVDHQQRQPQQSQHHGERVVYAEPQRQQTVELISVTSDEDQQGRESQRSSGGEQGIPYHAREYAQPFSYGDVAAAAAANAKGDNQGGGGAGKGTGMLKMQSGLSSPSLVRKQLGAPQHKNVPIRNDFEEMLRMRREKVDNEKYSISDGGAGGDNYKVNGAGGFTFEEKWSSEPKSPVLRPKSPGTVTFKRTVTTTTSPVTQQHQQTNGYVRTYEPVKRSNTMDTYNRSLSSDG